MISITTIECGEYCSTNVVKVFQKCKDSIEVVCVALDGAVQMVLHSNSLVSRGPSVCFSGF